MTNTEKGLFRMPSQSALYPQRSDLLRMLEADNTFSEYIDCVIAREQESLDRFFGTSIDVGEFKKTLSEYSREQFLVWEQLGLVPHYLPSMRCDKDANIPGWKTRPNDFFWDEAESDQILTTIQGRLLPDITCYSLNATTVLVDGRGKPDSDPPIMGGQQMFEKDNLLGPLLDQLRRDGRLAAYRYGDQSSRFGVCRREWEEIVKPALSQQLGITIEQLRLERAIEANMIPQIYDDLPRVHDGSTDTAVLYEEYVDDSERCLVGGAAREGGLSHVQAIHKNSAWRTFAIRPIIKL